MNFRSLARKLSKKLGASGTTGPSSTGSIGAGFVLALSVYGSSSHGGESRLSITSANFSPLLASHQLQGEPSGSVPRPSHASHSDSGAEGFGSFTSGIGILCPEGGTSPLLSITSANAGPGADFGAGGGNGCS